MKKYKFIFVSALFAVGLVSCGKDFIDSKVTEYTTNERKIEMINDPEVIKKLSDASLASSYTILQDPNRGHDDFGLRAFQLATDLMCEDMVQIKHHHFGFDYNLDNFGAPYRRTLSTWEIFYGVISNMNILLTDFFSSESTDPKYLAVKSEPLALRGIAYFHLVNFYQHTYIGHEQALGVPLMLLPTDGDKERATVKQVYDQIIQDLEFAVKHGANTDLNTDVDKAVAAAYLAKVYAQMEKWEDVERCAKIAQAGGATDKPSSAPRGFVINDQDVLWGYDVNAQTSDLYASFPSHMDFTTRGYAGAIGARKVIHNLLYNKIPKTDSRRKLWMNNAEFPEIYKNFENYGATDYDQLKFIGPDGFESDYIYIRIQDPILLEIEALVEQGKVGEAKTKLEGFVKLRDPEFVAPNDQNALREEVRFQRRIELWGEGTNWLDMKRWKMTIDRTQPNTNHKTKLLMKTDNLRYLHKLPQRELDANKLLVQNPDPEK